MAASLRATKRVPLKVATSNLQLANSTRRRRYNELTKAHYEGKGSHGDPKSSPSKLSPALFQAIGCAVFFGAAGYYFGGQAKSKPNRLDSVAATIPAIDTASTSPLDQIEKPEHNVSLPNLKAAKKEIEAIVGEENIITRLDEIERHTGSEWASHPPRADEAPAGIVMPANTEQVSEIMKICHRRRIPVVAFSGGTSLEGHFANTRRGLCIDFGRMNKILQVHKDDLDVVVEPGVGYEELNQTLAEQGLFFPPDPGPGAMIGGMVGTGCSGTNAFRYGTMKNWVVSLTVVLADGTIIKTRQRPVKSSAGYDLSRLFVGNEGTLGLVTEAVLKVTILPRNQSVAVVPFKSIRAAAECVDEVIQSGVQIAAVELLDEIGMKAINLSGATDREWSETPTIFFKFHGTLEGVKEEIAVVKQAAKAATDFIFAVDEQEAEDLWGARKTLLWGAEALKKNDDDKIWITDVAVPISRLPDIVEQTKADFNKCGLVTTIIGHVGDGNFHTCIFYSASEEKIAEEQVHKMVNRAIEMEGTITGEHGIGLVKRDFLPHEIGQDAVDAMRRIKRAFDPLCLLNCDKVVRMDKEH